MDTRRKKIVCTCRLSDNRQYDENPQSWWLPPFCVKRSGQCKTTRGMRYWNVSQNKVVSRTQRGKRPCIRAARATPLCTIKTPKTANSYDVLLHPEPIVTVDRIAFLDDGDRVFKTLAELRDTIQSDMAYDVLSYCWLVRDLKLDPWRLTVIDVGLG
jgi:hypothetical protein